MKKEIIKNKKNQNIVVLIEEVINQKGLAFVMHGLGGFKEQPQIQTITDAFKKNDYMVIRFDTTNTLGESDGKYEEGTATNYYEDLEDVINWAKSQTWYQEPFILAGHSIGGFCTAFYAEKYPDKVKALAPLSTVISGKLNFEAHKTYNEKELKLWQESGWKIDESRSKPGVIRRLPWSYMEDLSQYDLLKEADKLTMPVLMIVGENDNFTPFQHQKILYDKLTGKKEIHIIKGAEHTFRQEEHLKEIKQIFNDWLAKICPVVEL